MSENLPINVQLDEKQNGSVTFTTDVIATIAGVSAAEVDGVAGMSSINSNGLVDMITRKGGKNTKGVKAELSGGKVTLQLSIIVDFGSPIPEVAANIQDNVKKAIETMCGLEVTNVDIHVQGLSFEREEKRIAAEIEAQKNLSLKDGEEIVHPKVEPADIPQDELTEETNEPQQTAEATEKATEKADDPV